MNETEILTHIHELIATEQELREHPGDGDAPQTTRLRQIEESLDQCWDLLRQRRAHREFDQDPDESSVRPAGTVEGDLQ